MSREVIHDGEGALQVRFSYDRRLVDRIKSLAQRRWNALERFWWVPDTDVVQLVDLLSPEQFRFDAATRDLYRALGGTARLEPTAPAVDAPTLPGLFDVEAPEETGAEPGAGESDDLTVGQLNERVREVLQSAFPAPIWLVGEISGFNKSAHRRHVSFELAERAEDGGTVSKISATLFSSTRQEIGRLLRAAGDPFRLEDEITVRVRVRVELYVPWGQYRVVVEQLDINYTLGEAARRREEIVRRLSEAGLVGLNSAQPMADLPLSVALITSLGSDAYNDVLRTLNDSGFAFRVTAHGARVQGHATEPSVLNALDWFRDRAGQFDVLLICRGGGSRTDLVWFDSETLGRAVAQFPLPVVVGIGHEQDQSVLDAVGRSCRTPTAAAMLLVQTVQDSLDRSETLGRTVLELAAQSIREEHERSVERGARLARAARTLLDHERTRLTHRRQRTVLGARTLLNAARDSLRRQVLGIPRSAALHLQRQRLLLAAQLRSMLLGARREVEGAWTVLQRHAGILRPTAARLLSRAREHVDARERRLQLIDPRRVVERGYAILRGSDGRVLTEARAAPAGSRIRGELKRGALTLRSEGPITETDNGPKRGGE
jgi:exodeoxyribonuclease VII large subunit